MTVYTASPVKRSRATRAEMEVRAAFLLAYAERHAPVTVRQLYYAAEVHGMPGISKSDGDYTKIQRQVLDLRRAKRMPYAAIADATRWMRRPRSYDSVADALQETAALVLILNGTVAGAAAAILNVLEDVRSAVTPKPKSLLDAPTPAST